MTYSAYKVIHLFGVIFLFTAIGGSVFLRFGGVQQALEDAGANVRRVTGIVHGLALVLILISGFGALARLNAMQGGGGVPHWVWGKMAIWLVLGAALPMARKMPRAAGVLWWLLPLLGGLAAWLAVVKP